ncbi:MAG TPA: nitrilase-related carbon-nitrogen hydrolase [Stellaceae bacterium]|nr:nitrilase-related carbon-nitrogen hydrolase [Stellaceae bacterium]
MISSLRGDRISRLADAIFTGALLYLATGLNPAWWALWLAPIPLLLAVFAAGAREALVLTLVAALIGNAALAPYLVEVMTPVPATIVTVLRTLLWLLIVGRTRAAVLQSQAWWTVLVYPVLWSAVDLLIARFSADGTAASLAYSQMDALPVIQAASWGGTPAVVFLPSLFASLVAVAWHRRRTIRWPALGYVVPTAALVAILAWGAARAMPPDGEGGPKVAMAAIDGDFIAQPDALRGGYETLVDKAAADGAAIVVLPEEIAALDPEAAEKARIALAGFAKRDGIYLLAGIRVLAGDHLENRAWLFAPSGERIVDYAKRHLVTGLEGRIRPGDSDASVEIGAQRIGVAICKDMDFPALGRGYAALGVDAMLVPAWDFDADGWLHGRMAVLRGVEGGFAILRSARGGLMTVSDATGRVIAEKPSTGGAGALLLSTMPPSPRRDTLYARIGDAFGWACVLAAAAILVVPYLRRRRQ